MQFPIHCLYTAGALTFRAGFLIPFVVPYFPFPLAETARQGGVLKTAPLTIIAFHEVLNIIFCFRHDEANAIPPRSAAIMANISTRFFTMVARCRLSHFFLDFPRSAARWANLFFGAIALGFRPSHLSTFHPFPPGEPREDSS